MSETKRPRLALLVLIGLLLAGLGVLIWQWGWLRARLNIDFLPLDRSPIGPNLLASLIWAVVVGLFLTLLYPPFRTWLRKGADEWMHGHLARHRARQEDTHESLHSSTREHVTGEAEETRRAILEVLEPVAKTVRLTNAAVNRIDRRTREAKLSDLHDEIDAIRRSRTVRGR